jgi:hypothetical protein
MGYKGGGESGVCAEFTVACSFRNVEYQFTWAFAFAGVGYFIIKYDSMAFLAE